jgi:hypothetical protein
LLKDDSEGRRSPFQDLVFGITGHPIVLSNGGTQVFAIAPVGGSFYISVLSEGPDDWSPSVLVADDFFASAAVLKDGKSIRHIAMMRPLLAPRSSRFT